MPYCVHCGVELENGTPACPLCETPVIDPANLGFPPPPPLYPEDKPAGIPKLSRRVILILCSLLNLIPAFVTLVCDLSLTGSVTWSAYVLGAAIGLIGGLAVLLYAKVLRAYGKILVLGGIWSVYSFFVEYWMHGELRVPFALPFILYGALMLSLLCLVGRLMRKTPRPLLLVALFLLLAGGFCVLIEWQINFAYGITPRALWSIYPAGTAILLAGIFVTIDRSTTLKANLKKKLFI